MNTNNPDILFFVRREYGTPSIELRAYKVEKVNNEFAFLELERLRLVVFSGDFQSVSLHHEYGKNNCLYNSANNIPDLMKDMKRWQLSPIDRLKTFNERFVMKDIEVNGAHITDESAEILTQWQTKTEPVSACYIEVIEDLIDFLIEKGDESTPTNEVLRRIQLLRMMKKDIEKLSNP